MLAAKSGRVNTVEAITEAGAVVNDQVHSHSFTRHESDGLIRLHVCNVCLSVHVCYGRL